LNKLPTHVSSQEQDMSRIVMGSFGLFLVVICGQVFSADKVKKPSEKYMPSDGTYTGMQLHDPNRSGDTKRSRDYPCSFKVTRREDNQFVGEYWRKERNAKIGMKLAGTINGNGEVTAKIAQVIGGDVPAGTLDRHWEGRVTDTTLAFKWREKDGAVITVEMTLDGAEARASDRN
jgi:hypothetical protein